MDYYVFDKILAQRIITYALITVICWSGSLFGLFYNFKNMKNQKTMFCITNFLCVGLLVGSLIWSITSVSKLVYDIKNRAYIVWEGEFLVDYYTSSGNVSVFIPNEDGMMLETGDWPAAGKHLGTVIYSEKSKIVLDITIDETPIIIQ